MRKALVVCSIAIVAIMVSMGTSGAAGEIKNGNIATGAVDSRTIKDLGIYNRDIQTSAVNSRTIINGGVGYADLSASAQRTLQNAEIRSGTTVRGVIGGDFEGFAANPSGPCADNCDWGVDASLPFPAPVGLDDDHVLVDVSLCGSNCTGITADPDEAGSAATCSGSIAVPTAPAG